MSTPVSRALVRAHAVLLALAAAACVAAPVDVGSDTWAATDALGRQVPMAPAVPAPRPDRTVGMFYFLWHGAHAQGGPFDIARILAADPGAMQKPDSPLWGPLHVPHHWGESVFGYYRTADEHVLRKHAQMLSDAGVDMVVFDVTNQVAYRDDYLALLRVWSDMRRLGNRTPSVAFLTPFWDPSKVVRELWRDLYSQGLHQDLWFRWDGKPLVLADPDLLFEGEENARQDTPAALQPGHTLGQRFTSRRPLLAVGGRFPTWSTRDGALTLTLRKEGPAGEVVASRRFRDVADNAWLRLPVDPPAAPGTYRLEASDPSGRIGWWSGSQDVLPDGEALADGRPVAGDRTLRLEFADGDLAEVRRFFTFRRPQPDYFRGQTKPDMWSWLEVHPQHVFTNSAGQKEQVSVGVAQNAVGGRLGSMSEPGARGRSFHAGAEDTRPGAVRLGLNFAEQWDRALAEDPRFVFVTGWNEWIAGRFDEFNRVRLPVMFVDQFDQEHSRDIEPMRGGHGDDYYYQFVSMVRRYKGARPLPPAALAPVRVDGRFDDWAPVGPEYHDTVGDEVRRGHMGWATNVVHRNDTGRNDIVAAKASWDGTTAWFYVRTRGPMTSPDGAHWMELYLDVDADARTGWLGYDFVVGADGAGKLGRNRGGTWAWEPAGMVEFRAVGNEMELGIPWRALGLDGPPARLDFKWGDNCIRSGDWTDFTLNGDAAPNDRFNFRVVRP